MRQWTPEERQRQSELVHKWKPWEYSTGPRDTTKTRLNAMKHGLRSSGIFGNYNNLLKEYNDYHSQFKDALRDLGFLQKIMTKDELTDSDLKEVLRMAKDQKI